jgi:hypothetical protein
MIAMATAASDAATAITKRLKNIPSSLCGNKYLLNAMKLILTEFNISSTDIKMVMRFLLVRKPYIPVKNIIVARIRKYCTGISVFMLFLV